MVYRGQAGEVHSKQIWKSAGKRGYVACIIGAMELARRDETTRDFWPNQLYFNLALQNLIPTSEEQRGNDD
jgi:hypothetical protein